MANNKILAERLKELRIQNNLTQAKLAEFLNISQPAYAYYETGKKEPKIDTLEKLATLYKTSIDYLIGRY